MRDKPQRTEPVEHGQTCLFCHKTRDTELAVYSFGAGRLGICLECAIKAVEALQKHPERIAA